jgi:hypothetical protein
VAPPDDDPLSFEEEPVSLPSERGQAIVRITLVGDTIVRGENDFSVELVPLTPEADAALVGANGFMAAHGHGTIPPLISEADGTYLVSDLVLYMPGRWEITFELSVHGLEDAVRFPVDVP